jgi:hypothetical protein
VRDRPDSQQNPAAGISHVPWYLTDVTVLPGFRLFVRFIDGVEGEVDMSARVRRPDAGVFVELADPEAFAMANGTGPRPRRNARPDRENRSLDSTLAAFQALEVAMFKDRRFDRKR